MKLTITSDDLHTALAAVKPSVRTRDSIPLLTCFVLEARESALLVAGTNLEQTAHRFAAASIEQPGAICLPAKEFAAYVKLVPKGVPVTMERNWRGESLSVTFGASRMTMRGMSAAGFPNLPGVFRPGAYEERDEQEKAVLAAEAEERKRIEEAEKQAEHDRIAALPDRFIYEWHIHARVAEQTIFDTLAEAVDRWHDDYHGITLGPNGEWLNSLSITDKFGTAVVRYNADMERLYAEMHAEDEEEPPVDDDDEPDDPLAVMDDPAYDALVNHAVMAGDLDEYDALTDIPVTFAGQSRDIPVGPPPGVPCEEEVAAPVKVVKQTIKFDSEPKLRFGFKPDTIAKFFQRAQRRGATVKYAFAARHNGDLIEGLPVSLDAQHFYVERQGATVPVPRANVRYLECVA